VTDIETDVQDCHQLQGQAEASPPASRHAPASAAGHAGAGDLAWRQADRVDPTASGGRLDRPTGQVVRYQMPVTVDGRTCLTYVEAHERQDGPAAARFTARIDLSQRRGGQRALLKHLSGQPAAVICDLAGVRYLDPVLATVFSTVANHPASRWPTTSLLLCRAHPQVARVLPRAQAPHLVRLYGSVEEALAGGSGPPPAAR
jgi:hypothetical protein